MWEFFSRKKEPAAEAPREAVALPDAKGSGAQFEQTAELVTEQVNEKYAAILSQSTSVSAAPVATDIDTDAAKVSQATDAASRVTQLVELAQVKGVAHAVEVARKMNNLYVLDTMHDELADKLYEALKAKGLLSAE